ncbi:hypothetical protein [Streptomyces sp. Root369]|uniref:hypothetical protein n=1 Tax=Streptomyces sp. Root369 TaxID=1736523 RepID=UPI000ADA7995|nr:hypothetical protein [Streptomyces sp. Root369]
MTASTAQRNSFRGGRAGCAGSPGRGRERRALTVDTSGDTYERALAALRFA